LRFGDFRTLKFMAYSRIKIVVPMQNSLTRPRSVGFAIATIFLLISMHGCQSPSPGGSAPGGSDGAPIAEVRVAMASTRNIVEQRQFTGRTTPVKSVDIRARVSGYLLDTPRSKAAMASLNSSVLTSQSSQPDQSNQVDKEPSSDSKPDSSIIVSEGDFVKRGQLLFKIDPTPYMIALEQSKGTLESLEAKLRLGKQDLLRSTDLVKNNSISRAEYDMTVATAADIQGQITALKANISRNELDLDYTMVRSPIDGLLGRTLSLMGNLVVADNTILTTIVSNDPIYVDFDVDQQSVLEYRSRILGGEVKSARDTRINVRMQLSNETDFPHDGYIDFVNNITDPNTGNTRVRAIFDNPTRVLSPGLFALVKVPFSLPFDAIIIPTTAIGMDQQGRFVMVVKEDNHVERRDVELGSIIDDMTVIRNGIQVDERVVTLGLQKIKPGSEVRVQPVAEQEANSIPHDPVPDSLEKPGTKS